MKDYSIRIIVKGNVVVYDDFVWKASSALDARITGLYNCKEALLNSGMEIEPDDDILIKCKLIKRNPTLQDRLWYKCANCGNKGLSEKPIDKNSTCGGCNNSDFRLMKNQRSWIIGEEDYIHPEGTI